MAQPKDIDLKKGLKGVYFDRSTSCFIDGKKGKLLYRGYNIHDLAERSNFEETSYLILYGSLPTRTQLDNFCKQLVANRELPDAVAAVVRVMKSAHPMDVLRTAISAMSVLDENANDISPEKTIELGTKITAILPTIIAFHSRIRLGKSPISPNPHLDHSTNFLYMLFGNEPISEDANLINKDLILHAEHGVNASSFAARVAASTQADFYAAITTGLAVLKGPKHGGAAEGVMNMAQEIGSREFAEAYVRDTLEKGNRIMGYGHPVYKAVDPRSVHLKAEAKKLSQRHGNPKWFDILEAVTETESMKKRSKLGHHPNVDFWAGAIYSILNIPEDLFVPIFAMGRLPGWTAHIMEQYSRKDILRPRLLYNGPIDLEYVPIEKRT